MLFIESARCAPERRAKQKITIKLIGSKLLDRDVLANVNAANRGRHPDSKDTDCHPGFFFPDHITTVKGYTACQCSTAALGTVCHLNRSIGTFLHKRVITFDKDEPFANAPRTSTMFLTTGARV